MGGVLKKASDLDTVSDLPSLPHWVRSKDGQNVDTSQKVWKLRASADGGGRVRINWPCLEGPKNQPVLTLRALMLVKLYLADQLPRKKAGTLRREFNTFQRFDHWLAATFAGIPLQGFDWTDYTEGVARAFLTHGVQQTGLKGTDFAGLRVFYEWGVARQYPDFDLALLRILKSIRAIGNPKGHHVRSRDPKKGPFSPDEKLLIIRAIKAGAGAAEDRAFVMLHLELGLNPNAAARLKNKDLKRYETETAVLYQLDIPRMKKRTTIRETKRRPISKELGELLERLKQGGPEEPLFHWLPPADPEGTIRKALGRFAVAANLVSPRDGQQLYLHPRRFRYSFATYLAEEGASRQQIAEGLDHSTFETIDVYIQTVSSISDPVAQATDPTLGPLVARFLGKVSDAQECHVVEGAASRQLIPAAAPLLATSRLDLGAIGQCGRDIPQQGLCQWYPPLSCYLCPFFIALRNGPHRQVLDSIETCLEEWGDTVDQRAKRQLDDVRVAIGQVLITIEPRQKNEPNPEAGGAEDEPF